MGTRYAYNHVAMLWGRRKKLAVYVKVYIILLVHTTPQDGDYYYFVISSVWLTAFCQFSIKKMMMMMMMQRL